MIATKNSNGDIVEYEIHRGTGRVTNTTRAVRTTGLLTSHRMLCYVHKKAQPRRNFI